jgi:DNA-binding MltR family transcriptional regulator
MEIHMFWHWISTGHSAAEKEALMDAFSDIDQSVDRAAAIVAAAFLEDHLAIALKTRFHQDEKILNETFRSSGPLGSFSAKINLAFLIGLCSQEACKELHTIKDIRNEFAHKGLTRDFNSQRVRDLANNLTFGKKFEITIRRVGEEDDAEPGESVVVFGEEDMPKTPREHYIKACQMLLSHLVSSNRTSPPPPTPEF